MKRIVANTVVQWIGIGLSKACGFAFVLIITRSLGAEEYGKYNLVFTFMAFFNILSSFGIHTIAVREMAKKADEARRILGDVMLLSAVLSFLSGMLCILASLIMGYPRDIIGGIKIAVLTMFFLPLLTPSVFFEANLRMVHVVLGNLLRDISILLFAVMLSKRNASFINYIWASVAATAVTVVYYWIIGLKVVKPIIKIDLKKLGLILKEAMPLGLSGIALYVYNYIDTIMLSKMTSMDMVGLYGVAYKFVFISQQFPKAILVTLFPLFSRYTNSEPIKAKRYLQFTFDTIFIAALFLATMGLLYSWDIVKLLFGSQYIGSYRPLRVFSVNLLFMFPNMLLSSFLISNGQQTKVMMFMIITSAINLVANLYMIPHYGITGAALTTMISEWSFFLMAGITIYKDKLFRINPVPAVKMLLITAVILVLAKISKIIWWTEIIIMITIFIVITQIINAYDYRRLSRIIVGNSER